MVLFIQAIPNTKHRTLKKSMRELELKAIFSDQNVKKLTFFYTSLVFLEVY